MIYTPFVISSTLIMSTNDSLLRAESQTVLIYSLCIVFITLSTVIVGLRLYTRTIVLKALGVDDIAIVVAQVLAIATSVSTILEAAWGLGQHTQFVPLELQFKQVQALYSVIIMYNAGLIVVKASLLFQYRRLFPGGNTHKICFWFLVFLVPWGIVQEILLGLACLPIKIIVPSMADKCLSTLPIWYLTSAMNIATDFMVFIVPIPAVLQLHMGRRQKGLLCALFCLGFFTCAISLIRITTLHKAVDTTDPMWDNGPAAYWTAMELNCGIICACLPTLRPLISRVIPKLLSSKSGTHSGSHQLSSMHKKSHMNSKSGIYVHNEVEIHSTTELRGDAEAGSQSMEQDSQHEGSQAAAESKRGSK
ncbi:hypothetical protein GQ44DRAFT_469721 [Phaeosphaeriaceae sp. PMI808]|nr:hypothetical protein GQ44DRAFT_469721 [Phaeosphaeriaceae sp. PMI808]